MPRSGPRAVRKYSDEFKLTAVRLRHQPGIQVKTGRHRAGDPSVHVVKLAGVVFPTERTLRTQLKQYIRCYNTIRLHLGLTYLSPLAFEQRLA